MNCSIIICTYNRAKSLKNTLNHLQQQEYVIGAIEILVIDNGSIDDTQQIVQSFDKKGLHSIRYFKEHNLGLSYARNKGIAEAKGEIILFIDDDAIPSNKFWANEMVSAYRNPIIAAAGGDLEPIWPDQEQLGWLHSFFHAPLGLTSFNLDKITNLSYPIYPWGANISYRKKELIQLGGFSKDLGWSGKKGMIPGEESELCLRLEKAGKKIVYVPNATVQHYISKNKLNESWLIKRGYGQGVSFAIIDLKHHSKLKVLLDFIYYLILFTFGYLMMVIYELLNNKKYRTLFHYHVQCARGFMISVLETIQLKF